MRAKWIAALALLTLVGCRTPGERLAVNGRLEPVTHPELGRLHLAIDGDRFYWVEGGSLRARDVAGGPDTVLAAVSASTWRAPVVTREHIAVADETSLVIVPRKGGEPRRLAVRDGIADLAATAHTLVWATSPTPFRATPAVVALDLREPSALPREIAPLAGARVVVDVLGSDAHDTFAVLLRTEDGAWRVDAGDALAGPRDAPAPLRTLHAFPRRPLPGSASTATLDDDFVSIAVGSAHLFVTPPASGLYPSPTELLAVPLAGGAALPLGDVCPNTLSVLGDDVVVLATPRSSRCPGELPGAQTLALVRVRVADRRRETLYAAYTGAITSAPAGPHALLLGERVPLPHPEGSAPRYESRTARLGAL